MTRPLDGGLALGLGLECFALVIFLIELWPDLRARWRRERGGQ